MFDFVKKLFSRQTNGGSPGSPDDDSSPGWEAIDAAVKPLYPGQEPQHWGTLIKWMLGGPDPLDGVSAYRADRPPHWHYVTYGMTELYAKDSEDVAVSGWGFELTFRLKRDPGSDVVPIWPVSLLQNLARYVFNSGNRFDHGHYIDCNGPIAAEESTDLVALLFLRDSELPPIDSPHGRVEFLQVVGITADEHDACRMWNSESFAAVLLASNPLLVTDLARKSVLSDPLIARQVEEGQARDGSSSTALHVDALAWKRQGTRWVIEMTATGFEAISAYLRGRLGLGRDFAIIGDDQTVDWQPDVSNSVSASGSVLTIHLSPESREELVSVIAPKRGTYDITGLDVTFEVRPALIRDEKGEVVREIG